MAFPVSSSKYAGENHQQKIERFIFYRDFLAHSRDLDSFHCPARSHGLSYNNCWAGLWGTAGPQRECHGCHSIQAGYTATGRCRCNVTEKAASPSRPSQECTSLEPLPARQRGHPVAPPRQTSLSALKWAITTAEKAAVLPQKGDKVRNSTSPVVFPLCLVLGAGPSPPSPELFLWDEDKGLVCGMKIKILLLKGFNRPYYLQDAIRTS